ncbi:2-hydroxyacid dehydrogenase [Arthrobacter livingstonensis]|uniref:2-hydroxyacid dehydrogenase n=1 Tax=Arthrobacter livingstonensis TaxID=670078 RepID=A0A2V5L2K2_9MICC|nr:C-terminal binding protein [Arthrobacter livingstonensis]PYI64702.1 2-hydroxyacid dehydrogenase [Arthrobacter livingstonensis]
MSTETLSSTTQVKLRAVYTDMDDVDFAAGTQLLREAGFQVDYLETQDPARITAQAGNATALLVGYAPVTAVMMDAMPSLRIIALLSMGFNNIDVEAARKRGIWVTNIPGAATEEVATHALALSLALTRGLPFYSAGVQCGDWNIRDTLTPPRLSRSRLGILGLGRIGTRFAQLSASIFGEVIGYDPVLPDTPEIRERLRTAGIRRTTLEEVRDTSTVLSLHMPLTPETSGMIDAGFLAHMPKGSYLINVSRGSLVDSAAVRYAVDSGHLAGAGLDVLDQEPPAAGKHPLLGHPRILVTPHMAYLSDFTETEYVRQQAQNVASWKNAGHPDSPVIELHQTVHPPLIRDGEDRA